MYLFYTPGGIDSGWVEAESPFWLPKSSASISG